MHNCSSLEFHTIYRSFRRKRNQDALTFQTATDKAVPDVVSYDWEIKNASGYSGGDARMMSKDDAATSGDAGGDGACRK